MGKHVVLVLHTVAVSRYCSDHPFSQARIRMTLPARSRSCIALAALVALAACGGQIASEAPALLTIEEIAARAATTTDTTRGIRAQNTLQYRGARLRARAAQIRRAGLADAERHSLLRRADRMKTR